MRYDILFADDYPYICKTDIGSMRLIDKYQPSDYSDTVSKRIKPAEPLSSDYIFEEMFCNFPGPVAWLFKLRDFLAEYTSSGFGCFTKSW